MRVVVASSEMPFVAGGASLLVDWLEHALRECGHDVEIFRLPFDQDPNRWLEQYLAYRLLDLADTSDRLITLRTPAHLFRHPNKVVWFIHHLRGAFDLWATPYQDLPATLGGAGLREAIRAADNLALGECRHLFVNSQIMSNRVLAFNQLQAEVLYPPLLQPERYRNLGDDGYFLYVSRLTPHKRQHLAIEAASKMRSGARLVIAGNAGEGEAVYLQSMRMQVAAWGLENRVSIEARWISEEEKQELVGRCRALLYFPYDEDSYGFPVIEAFAAGKPVITTIDAGGTQEIVTDGENGVVCAGNSESIAAAMDELADDKRKATSLGAAGAESLHRLGLNWPYCVEKLLT